MVITGAFFVSGVLFEFSTLNSLVGVLIEALSGPLLP